MKLLAQSHIKSKWQESKFVFFWERERERERERESAWVGEGRGRERKRKSEAGLNVRTVRSWPEPKSRIRCLTNWATRELQESDFELMPVCQPSVSPLLRFWKWCFLHPQPQHYRLITNANPRASSQTLWKTKQSSRHRAQQSIVLIGAQVIVLHTQIQELLCCARPIHEIGGDLVFHRDKVLNRQSLHKECTHWIASSLDPGNSLGKRFLLINTRWEWDLKDNTQA